MEFCDTSLLHLVRQRRRTHNFQPFLPQQILKVALDISNALSYLHNERHILHGDLKSANILVSGDFSVVKLCDFGVSIELNRNLCGQKNPKEIYQGTEEYWPKETIAKKYQPKNITDRTDIYPFGLSLWEMVSLRCPFTFLHENDSYEKEKERLNTHEMDVDEKSKEKSESEEAEESEEKKLYKASLGTCPELPSLDYSYTFVNFLIKSCCNEDWQKRPNSKQVFQWAEGAYNNDGSCELMESDDS